LTSTDRRAPTWSAANLNRRRAAIITLFATALGLRLWGINFGLPALYRPDEDVTVGRAMGVLQGILNPHFADWPHLYFYLAAAWLAPLRLLGIVSSQASGYLGVRILDALLGSLTVVLVFDFGRRAYGFLAGLFGAAALAVAFLHVRDSHFALLDIPLTLSIMGGLWFAYRTLGSPGIRPLLLNGIALGISASLKYNGALVFAGMAAAQMIGARLERARLIRVAGRLAMIAIIGVAVLLITSPFLLLDFSTTRHGVTYIFQHLGTSTAPAIGWVELIRAMWYGMDPVLTLLAVVGLAYAGWRRQPADWILVTFVLVYFLAIGSGGSVFFRYLDPLVPPLVLLGGRALADLCASALVRRTRWLAIAACMTVIALPALLHDVRFDMLIQQPDTRTLAYNWLQDHVPVGARAAVPYFPGPAHDQHLVDSNEHSHGATDPYVSGFLDGRLETRYSILELVPRDLEQPPLARFREEGISYVVVADQVPGMGCQPDTPLERALLEQGEVVATFSPTSGCPDSTFDPIDAYYVPLAGYSGWRRPGPPIRIYRFGG
jgi:Dolichyl-phosphate-mannose-protein mannosyltransferase